MYGTVGPFPLDAADLDELVYPALDAAERAAVLEGLAFFTTPHTPAEGAGPFANQPMCLGCHTSSAEAVGVDGNGNKLVTAISQASRAARSTPTNFTFTSFDPATGGGRAPESDDAIRNTGRTAAFTIFGDFSPSTGTFEELLEFSGFVQHVRPSLTACLPDPILPIPQDPNLSDPASGFRRAVGERAGPPYIGRGLMEAVFDGDITANADPEDRRNHLSSLDDPTHFPECPNDCISGRANRNTSDQAFVGGDPRERVGHFGLRAAGPTMMQFVAGGLQGELSFTSVLNPDELTSHVNVSRPGCVDSTPEPEAPLSTPLSLRALIRLTAPPEFGHTLLDLLRSPDPAEPRSPATPAGKVQRGAMLFGIDLVAFANRMIPGRMPKAGDGRDSHAINQEDRLLNCAGCHTPVFATGQLPGLGTRHTSNVWAPLFSDLLIHEGPNVQPERTAPTPRLPLRIQRVDGQGNQFNTFDLPRGLADDALPNQGLANGLEFRTAPLMGLGRMGPPFLHDARVYLSNRTMNTNPAGTVFTDNSVTNAPVVVRTLDDALRAAIELHDLPAPVDASQSTPLGGGCPVPPGNRHGNIFYAAGATDICPPYHTTYSQDNRGEAREVIRRYRALSPADQQALIEFLKQL